MIKHASFDPEVFETSDENSAGSDVPKRKRGRPFGSKTKTTKELAKFTVNEFSFVRAIVQGMPAALAADRYLVNKSIPASKAENLVIDFLRHIKDSAVALLESERLSDEMRFVVADSMKVVSRYIEPTSGSEVAANVKSYPTLDEFVEQNNISIDFYSEREILEMYFEEYPEQKDEPAGAVADANTNRPSISALVAALGSLQSHTAISPNPTDSVSTWFHGKFPSVIRIHGVLSIQDLANWVNINGRAWYTRLPYLGKHRASRITRWLIDNEEYTKVVIKPEIRSLAHFEERAKTGLFQPGLTHLAPAQQPGTNVQSYGLVPADSFAWPAHLLGHDSAFKASGTNAYGARNDAEAVQAWFDSLGPLSKRTLAVYRAAIEKLMLWALVERGIPLSSLRAQDFAEYREFLKAPPAHWVQRSPVLKGSRLWRPMRGPLSEESVELNMQAISLMFRAWHTANYTHLNACVGVTRSSRKNVKLDVSRTLTLKDIEYVKSTLAQLPEGPEKNRLHAIILLLITSGLRASELSSLRWSQVERAVVGMDTTDTYVLRVIGKGNKERMVPIKHSVYLALLQHRKDRIELARSGPLSDFADFAEGEWPLIGILVTHRNRVSSEEATDYPFFCSRKENTTGEVSYERLKNIVSNFLTKCARKAEESGDDGSRLRAATPHWLRHTFAHLILRATGNDVSIAQALLGHSSIATTGIYVKALLEDRISGVEKIPELL